MLLKVNGSNSSLPVSRFNYRWVVPFDYATDAGTSKSILLTKVIRSAAVSDPVFVLTRFILFILNFLGVIIKVKTGCFLEVFNPGYET